MKNVQQNSVSMMLRGRRLTKNDPLYKFAQSHNQHNEVHQIVFNVKFVEIAMIF